VQTIHSEGRKFRLVVYSVFFGRSFCCRVPNKFCQFGHASTRFPLPGHRESNQARYDHREGNDDYTYTQAGNLFRLMNQEQRERLFGNIARHMQASNNSRDIQLRQLCHFYRADPNYGSGVAKALGIDSTGMVPERAERPEALAAMK
jgi:catalase